MSVTVTPTPVGSPGPSQTGCSATSQWRGPPAPSEGTSSSVRSTGRAVASTLRSAPSRSPPAPGSTSGSERPACDSTGTPSMRASAPLTRSIRRSRSSMACPTGAPSKKLANGPPGAGARSAAAVTSSRTRSTRSAVVSPAGIAALETSSERTPPARCQSTRSRSSRSPRAARTLGSSSGDNRRPAASVQGDRTGRPGVSAPVWKLPPARRCAAGFARTVRAVPGSMTTAASGTASSIAATADAAAEARIEAPMCGSAAIGGHISRAAVRPATV